MCYIHYRVNGQSYNDTIDFLKKKGINKIKINGLPDSKHYAIAFVIPDNMIDEFIKLQHPHWTRTIQQYEWFVKRGDQYIDIEI